MQQPHIASIGESDSTPTAPRNRPTFRKTLIFGLLCTLLIAPAIADQISSTLLSLNNPPPIPDLVRFYRRIWYASTAALIALSLVIAAKRARGRAAHPNDWTPAPFPLPVRLIARFVIFTILGAAIQAALFWDADALTHLGWPGADRAYMNAAEIAYMPAIHFFWFATSNHQPTGGIDFGYGLLGIAFVCCTYSVAIGAAGVCLSIFHGHAPQKSAPT